MIANLCVINPSKIPLAEKFRTADASYDGNLVDGKISDDNIEEGAMCGPLKSEKKESKKDESLYDKVSHGLRETYEDLSKVKNADESLYDKFKHGVEVTYEDVSKIKEALDDEVESTFEKAGLGVPYHFIKGGREALADEVEGLINSVIHPIDTFNNTIEAISHPVETFNAIKQAISDSWNNDVVNGDWNSSAAWYGSASAHAILAVGQLFVGTKGVDKIAMLKPGTKLVEMSQNAKQGFEYATSLFNRNHKEFAIAGAGSERPSIKDFLWRADSGEIDNTPDFRQVNKITIPESSIKHSDVGDFTTNPKTGDISKMKGGGHGQSNIEFLEKNNIDYEITKVYENGVRIGNVSEHKVKRKRTGSNQSWFPENWTDSDIAAAGTRVAELPEFSGVENGVTIFGEYNGVRVGVIKTDGEIGTIFPDATQQP